MSYDPVSIRKATVIDRSRGYFTLPAFTYSFSETGAHAGSTDHTVDELTLTTDINDSRGNPLMWNGASQRITQWNYASPNNFVLTELPDPPDSPDFLLCIAFRVGDEVFRYKLWEGIGEVLNSAPLYGNQIIKKNFTLEIWSTQSTNSVNLTSAIQLSSSIMAIMVDDEDYEVVTGIEASNQLYQSPTVTVDTSTLVSWYRGDLSQLTVDAVGEISAAALYQGSGPNLVASADLTIADTDTDLFGHSFAEADPVKGFSAATNIDPGTQWIAMLKIPTGTADGTVLEAPGFQLDIIGGQFELGLGNGFTTTFDIPSGWFVIYAKLVEQGTDTTMTVSVNTLEGEILFTDTETLASGAPITAGPFVVINCYFADFITFSAETDVTNYVKALQLFYGLILFDSTLDSITVLADNT